MDGLKIHTLKNGATVISLSAHPFKFSDGTECGGQGAEIVNALTLKREERAVGTIKGMGLFEVKMALSEAQERLLGELCSMADIVILPFPVLTALRESGIRKNYPNAVAFNATKETMRCADPKDKIIDIERWSY
jgi:hypothetical protein